MRLLVQGTLLRMTLGRCVERQRGGSDRQLRRAGEVPAIEWRKDFQTWEGLGGWIVVNLVWLDPGISTVLFTVAHAYCWEGAEASESMCRSSKEERQFHVERQRKGWQERQMRVSHSSCCVDARPAPCLTRFGAGAS